MNESQSQDFIRYLAAKKSIDDRALNRGVREALRKALVERNGDRTLEILELGAGIGTMVERLLEWGLLTSGAYTALDSQQNLLEQARIRLSAWAPGVDYEFRAGDEGLRLLRGDDQLKLSLVHSDVFAYASKKANQARYDLLIAHAFLDLVDLTSAVPLVLNTLKPGGLCYFTLNFDGETVLQPSIDSDLDRKIEYLYHQSMDLRRIEGRPSGDSRTGRHLFDPLRAAGANILAAGASDWVVFAPGGAYLDDDAFFLTFIMDTIHGALQGHPDLDSAQLDSWVQIRKSQIERGELVYIAHQIDLLAGLPPA